MLVPEINNRNTDSMIRMLNKGLKPKQTSTPKYTTPDVSPAGVPIRSKSKSSKKSAVKSCPNELSKNCINGLYQYFKSKMIYFKEFLLTF